VHDVENWKEPAVGIRSKDTQETLSWHHALASSMVMPLWLGSSLRPEHAISEVMAQTAGATGAVSAGVVSTGTVSAISLPIRLLSPSVLAPVPIDSIALSNALNVTPSAPTFVTVLTVVSLPPS
jgi:hypothetical protein